MNQVKMFTIEEANALVPELNKIIKEIQVKREEIEKKEVSIDALELVANTGDTGSSPVVNRELDGYQQLVNSFYALVDRIHEKGCFLKDVDLGLIDFYSVQQGRVVYLCWKKGEKKVDHWHEIGLGFTHRQPLK